MKNALIWAAAMMILVAGMVVTGASSAEAGLFNCKDKCCKPLRRSRKQEACCVEATPACDSEAAPACGAEIQTCGCQSSCSTTNCACLNKRQLRRANRKGECCGGSDPAPEAAPEAPEADATT